MGVGVSYERGTPVGLTWGSRPFSALRSHMNLRSLPKVNTLLKSQNISRKSVITLLEVDSPGFVVRLRQLIARRKTANPTG
jgi:hypothetical protein